MARTQNREVVPPLPHDKDSLNDFSSVIQSNLTDLFVDAHVHTPLTAAPSNTEGITGDIRIVLVGTTWYLYAKVATNTWKKVALA